MITDTRTVGEWTRVIHALGWSDDPATDRLWRKLILGVQGAMNEFATLTISVTPQDREVLERVSHSRRLDALLQVKQGGLK